MSSGSEEDRNAPLRLPTWWPEASGQVRFPTDSSLPTAARALRGHLDALGAAMSSLHAEGLVTADDVGNWDAGQEFSGTVKAAHEHIASVYREFQRQLEAAATLLMRSHQGHTEAEESSAKASRPLDGAVPPSLPRPVPTQRTAPSMD